MVLCLLLVLVLYLANVVERRQNRQEQYAVWSAFLSAQFLENFHDWGPAGACLVVIEDQTARRSGDEGTWRDAVLAWLSLPLSRTPILETDPATFRSFLRRNLWRECVTRNLQISARYEIAPAAEMRTLHEAEAFDRRFPGNCGFVTLSAVGFNADRSEAFFSEDHFSCGLCGGGGHVLMRKKDGRWQVVSWIRGWVS